MEAQTTAALPPHLALIGDGDAGDGLTFGWLFRPGEPPVALRLAEIQDALDHGGIVWVHLNATASRAKQWLADCGEMPEPVRDTLIELDERTRLERIGDKGILGVIGDTVAGADLDPWHFATIRFYVNQRLLVSTRRTPVNCASKLARAIRDGLAITSTAELLVGLLQFAADSVASREHELAHHTDRTEDEVLTGRIEHARQQLGRARRRAAKLRRQVALRDEPDCRLIR